MADPMGKLTVYYNTTGNNGTILTFVIKSMKLHYEAPGVGA